MGQTIACTNQKGGVGKTTTVVNLATYLALLGDRVLVIDLDPQGNATSGFGVDRASLDGSVYDALVDGLPARRAPPARPRWRASASSPRRSPWPAPRSSSPASTAASAASPARSTRSATPGTGSSSTARRRSGILTVNALTGADAVLVPIQCEYYALEGLTQLIATINLVRDHLNPDLAITGVLLTMFDGRTNLSTEVAAEVRRHLHEAVFETVVPRSVRLSEAPSHGLPIALYRPESKGAEAYRDLAIEVRGRRPTPVSGNGHVQSANGTDRAPTPDARTVDPARGDRRMTVRTDRSASALGRGLASLIPQRPTIDGGDRRGAARAHRARTRTSRATASTTPVLEELAASIREHGVLQPVLVTETLDGYQLVAGERRVRAARLAGLERIPALVRQLADRDQLEVALVENVQRADLDPIDEALAYRQLIEEFGLTQEHVAERVGKARATVANTLRLLDLHADVQAAIADGRLTEGHGRALGGLPVDGQAHVARHGHRAGPVGPPDRGAGPAAPRAAAARASAASRAAARRRSRARGDGPPRAPRARRSASAGRGTAGES